MLDALTASDQSSVTPADADNASTDLVGSWRAVAGDLTVDLTITEQSDFKWKATTKGQPPVTLEGQITADSDAVVLVNEQQGSMAGAVKSLGPTNGSSCLRGLRRMIRARFQTRERCSIELFFGNGSAEYRSRKADSRSANPKREAFIDQSLWDNVPTIKHQFRIGAKNKRCRDANHPCKSRRPIGTPITLRSVRMNSTCETGVGADAI